MLVHVPPRPLPASPVGTPLGAPGHQVSLGGLCVEATCCILSGPGGWETGSELLGTSRQEACRDLSRGLRGSAGGLGTWARED